MTIKKLLKTKTINNINKSFISNKNNNLYEKQNNKYRGLKLIEKLSGKGTSNISTVEIMKLTRELS